MTGEREREKGGGGGGGGQKAKEPFENIILQLDLTDIWRESNPDIGYREKKYTTEIELTAQLPSVRLSDMVYQDNDILPGYRSDYSLIT